MTRHMTIVVVSMLLASVSFASLAAARQMTTSKPYLARNDGRVQQSTKNTLKSQGGDPKAGKVRQHWTIQPVFGPSR